MNGAQGLVHHEGGLTDEREGHGQKTQAPRDTVTVSAVVLEIGPHEFA